MKTNIKMRVTREQSKRVQEICFKNNIAWHGVKAFYHLRQPYIYVYENTLGYDCKESSEYFDDHENIEIDADLFIRTNGTCEENQLKDFIQSQNENIDRVNDWIKQFNDVSLKLKKKNEILKKARIKRKNQKEELHKLNLKLQKCISLEKHNKKIESIEFDLNMFKSSNKLRGNLIEKLERDAKESIKDIKELESLNNVLKMENKSLKESSKISCNMLHSQKDKIDRLEFNYVAEQSNYNKEIEKLKAVIEYLESKVK